MPGRICYRCGFSLALTPMDVDYFGMLFRPVFWIVENAAQGNPHWIRP
jgi:hypothetical protein